ncbi:MAG: chromosomal replication initiator protein DnaA [Planctomycetota bacterium]|jgi:chromosomal replication initiator protein
MQETLARSWGAIRGQILKEVGERRFNLWVKNTVFQLTEDDAVEIGTPNIFVKEWLARHYAAVIGACIERVTQASPPLRFVVDPGLAAEVQASQEDEEGEPEPEAASAPPAPKIRPQDLGLRPEFSFENFVVGACNRLAAGAARSVCEEPGTLYNPLFVYGASGLGKTHILQAVAREFALAGKGKVLYLSCEAFVNGFIDSLKHKSVNAFRERFRNIQLLVVDDVHILSNKEATQEEFLHTFNACFNHGRQIVMASDSHPNAIKTLRRELRGRFVAGLLARLDPPSYMTRLEILRKKAKNLAVQIPEDVLAFLAHHIRSNVRVLEGALTSLVARGTLLNEPLTVGEAAEALKMVEEKREKIITLGDVEDGVVSHFGISSQDLHSKSRKRRFLVPRQICMFLARRLTSHSLKEIGQYFGKRDHVTVIYAIKKVEETGAADPEFMRLLEAIEDKIRHPDTWANGKG